MPNLTQKEEQRKSLKAVYQGNSVFVWLPTGCGSKFFGHSSSSRGPCFCLAKDLHSLHTLLLLAMITCFMSNIICRVGGGLCLFLFLFIHTSYFFTGRYYSSILRCFVATEQRT